MPLILSEYLLLQDIVLNVKLFEIVSLCDYDFLLEAEAIWSFVGQTLTVLFKRLQLREAVNNPLRPIR
jgi:hypothetical protein